MALTEKYVSALAAGGGTGLTAGSPLTLSEMVTAINAGTQAGVRFNVKADGTYSRSATDTISGSGTSTSPVVIRGYATTIGDGYLGRTNGNGSLIVTNLPSVAYASTFRMAITGQWVLLESLNFSGTVSNGLVTMGTNGVITRCKVVNASTNAAAAAVIQTAVNSILIDNDLALTGASGGLAAVNAQGNGAKCFGNRVTAVSAPGILCGGFHSIVGNTVYSGTVSISMASTTGCPFIFANTLVSASGDGVDVVTGTTTLQCVLSNIIVDNGGYAIDANSAAVAVFSAYNRTRDNTAGAANGATDWLLATGYGNVTSGAGTSDFVNAAGNDYRLVSTSPAKAAGLPQYASIGALQREEAAGGGSIFRTPLLTTGDL